MDITWTQVCPSIVAAFLASLVEFVEALTVILAVGSTRSWRGALSGASVALAVLLAVVTAFGTALTRVPLDYIQLGLGSLLLLFGLRWLRKAVLRAAGVIPVHDEVAVFAKEAEVMRRFGRAGRWDKVAFGAAFQITMLEGAEVVFIVIAMGAGDRILLLSAGLGALAALVTVALLGLALHRPLASVPENTLKFVVGALLSAFGSFWVGEGIGLGWPGADWSVLGLIGGFLLVARLAVPVCRVRSARRPA
jgi:Ca2+/H+ antiporter, TMEM165/GDT1 family